jgi:hypothetical protein
MLNSGKTAFYGSVTRCRIIYYGAGHISNESAAKDAGNHCNVRKV